MTEQLIRQNIIQDWPVYDMLYAVVQDNLMPIYKVSVVEMMNHFVY